MKVRPVAGWSRASIEVTGKFPALCLHSTTRETMEPLEPEPEPALGGAAGTSDANGSAGDKELLGAIRTLFDAMDSDQDGVSDLGRQRPVGCLARSALHSRASVEQGTQHGRGSRTTPSLDHVLAFSFCLSCPPPSLFLSLAAPPLHAPLRTCPSGRLK